MADVDSLINALVDTRISGVRSFTRCVSAKTRIILLVFLCFEALFARNVLAEVRLPSIYTDHMVLQRNLPVVVQGSADAGEAVAVTFRGETGEAVSDKFGRWQITLLPGAAGGPFVMEIHGKNAIRLSDVLVGDAEAS
jgi:sialate O-acetylesterase